MEGFCQFLAPRDNPLFQQRCLPKQICQLNMRKAKIRTSFRWCLILFHSYCFLSRHVPKPLEWNVLISKWRSVHVASTTKLVNTRIKVSASEFFYGKTVKCHALPCFCKQLKKLSFPYSDFQGQTFDNNLFPLHKQRTTI